MNESVGEYPSDWDEIAHNLKCSCGWMCERCGHVHDVESGHVLTVHHLIPDKSLCEKWNLAVLCQRCHLKVQASTNLYVEECQLSLFRVRSWLAPHVEGLRKWLNKQ